MLRLFFLVFFVFSFSVSATSICPKDVDNDRYIDLLKVTTETWPNDYDFQVSTPLKINGEDFSSAFWNIGSLTETKAFAQLNVERMRDRFIIHVNSDYDTNSKIYIYYGDQCGISLRVDVKAGEP
ncbi:hypothetical protein OPS25_10770 [Alteromonas ponticola]|uniref:Uncharacterized protein n=1 Tax=Alteromonas aquimaris TaxID=2998417 RepID=A0ABT3PA77_9ALTE|nr:hypothetical protein [Alteromonas aquimaris]MCW8108976.1 hypothetical protein [Alteromonas aquimaris]